MKKNETLALIGLGVVAYFLFSQTSQAGSGVNIPPPGGFVGPCQPPSILTASGCVIPQGGTTTTNNSGGSTFTDILDELI